MILTAQPKNDAGCSIHEMLTPGPSLRRDRHTERSFHRAPQGTGLA
jgi:hypothetical protein